MKIILKSEKTTTKLAKYVAELLKKGDVLALYGQLGAGKTFFTRQLCTYLGVKENVSSPSFVLLNEYEGRFRIFHFDLYRLRDEAELLELGLYEIFHQGITIIEWPEVSERLLPSHTKKLRFFYSASERYVLVENFENTETLMKNFKPFGGLD